MHTHEEFNRHYMATFFQNTNEKNLGEKYFVAKRLHP